MTYRIARLGTLSQPVPAVEYGGTQRSMAQMTAFQAALLAHDITVYASADSSIVDFSAHIAGRLGLSFEKNGGSVRITNADGRTGVVRLRHTGCDSTGYNHPDSDALQAQLIDLFLCDEQRRPYDLIHSHYAGITSRILLPRELGYKTLTHQHTGKLPESYPNTRFPLICISQSQKGLLEQKYNANVAAVIPHGLDSFTHDFSPQNAGYAAWIGRFLEEKGAHRAIAIARRAEMPLVLAGMIYEDKPKSAKHFERDVKPHIDICDPELLNRMKAMNAEQARAEIVRLGEICGVKNPVIFVGAASDVQKQTLYGFASATLFPISWPEPFGRVMIESMACGTPVIGHSQFGHIHCGSVDEIIQHGKSGYLLAPRNEEDCITAGAASLRRAGRLDRAGVRRAFDENCTSERNARQIGALYAAMMHPAGRELKHILTL